MNDTPTRETPDEDRRDGRRTADPPDDAPTVESGHGSPDGDAAVGDPGGGPSPPSRALTGEPDGAERDATDDRYRLRVGDFEGPLDVLLHLVRINEVDITDIPILEITRQYHEFLDLMRELDLEIAGEYVVMAATLMHIKSRMLLPPDPDAEGEDEAEDPRTELVEQLLEYQRYKQAAENLSAIDSRRTLIWTREGEVPEEFRGEELLTVDLTDLVVAFRKLLGRLDEEARLRLKQDNVSVAEKIQWLGDLLEERGTMPLLPLLEGLPTRLDKIATFLAMLEMMRLRMIVAFQRTIGGEIRIARREDVEEASPEDREAAEPLPGDPALEPDVRAAAGDGHRVPAEDPGHSGAVEDRQDVAGEPTVEPTGDRTGLGGNEPEEGGRG
jgi:segregation and condensation protein A